MNSQARHLSSMWLRRNPRRFAVDEGESASMTLWPFAGLVELSESCEAAVAVAAVKVCGV